MRSNSVLQGVINPGSFIFNLQDVDAIFVTLQNLSGGALALSVSGDYGDINVTIANAVNVPNLSGVSFFLTRRATPIVPGAANPAAGAWAAIGAIPQQLRVSTTVSGAGVPIQAIFYYDD